MKNQKPTKTKEYNSKEFLLEFFKDSAIDNGDNVLTISNVSPDFENFIGKKAPYKFVFDIATHDKIKDSELIMQGSYFLLAIRDYLSDKGQTSLLKIHAKLDSTNPLFKKYKILESKESSLDYIYQFSFSSVYQYLNDKKQSTNTFLMKSNSPPDINMNKFKTSKCSNEEISSIDPTAQYNIAKSLLDKKVKEEIKPLKIILKEKLSKELFRVKDHYHKQIKEKDDEVESCANKIKMLQSKLRHTSYERDRSILRRLIRESEERLEMLKKKSYKERLKAEELFHINDEIEKHALSIKNSLINLTVFAYPIFEIHVSAKGKKEILKYDPILNKVI
ncbi:MAG: hypothetical protein WCK29_01460 [archaeon]